MSDHQRDPHPQERRPVFFVSGERLGHVIVSRDLAPVSRETRDDLEVVFASMAKAEREQRR